MGPYYCAFCSSRYQYYKTRSDGLMICTKCGDELIKVPFLKMTQIIGLIGASAFLVPFLLMIVVLFKELNHELIKNSSEQITFLTINLDDAKSLY